MIVLINKNGLSYLKSFRKKIKNHSKSFNQVNQSSDNFGIERNELLYSGRKRGEF